jgi:hypothetical protein
VTNSGAVAVAALSHKQNPLLPLRFRAKNICWPKRLIGRPQEALLCGESKAPSRNGNQPHFMVMCLFFSTEQFMMAYNILKRLAF